MWANDSWQREASGMAYQHSDERIRQESTGTTMKRRGLLAGAAALVAGIAAKQAAQPVSAGTDGDVVLGGASNAAASGTTIINNAAATYESVAFAGVRYPGWSGSFVVSTNAGLFGRADLVNGYGVFGFAPQAFGIGVQGQSSSYLGVVGKSLTGIGVYGTLFPTGDAGGANTAVKGELGTDITAANTVAVDGNNVSIGTGGIGVKGTATKGLGASFQGGIAPLRLVPGTLSARTLTAAGHQAGELYMTSDNRLFLFDGTNWREVLLAAPGSGVPPAAVARPSSAGTATQPVQPAPIPRSG
jgi:hypothetical protein